MYVVTVLRELNEHYDELSCCFRSSSNDATPNYQNNASSQSIDTDYTNQPLIRQQDRRDKWDKQDRKESNEDEIEVLEYIQCGICLDPCDQDSNSDLVQLSCEQNHVFHSECISVWLAKKGEWPLCKSIADMDKGS